MNLDEKYTPEEIKAVCEHDLELFAYYYFSHYIKYPSGEFHRWLYKLFTTQTKRKTKIGCKWAIAAPRGNAKSSVATLFFPLWCTVYKKKNFIIIISDTAGQAEDFLKEVKIELINNELLNRDFPDACGQSGSWRLDEITTNNNVKIAALGSQNKILGKRHGTSRPDLILGDDLENQDNVASPLMRERIVEWFFKEVLKAGEIDGSTDFYVVGTIKHEDSLLNNLLDKKKYPAWSGKIFRAVKSFADDQELWREWEIIYSDKENEHRFEDAQKFYDENEEALLEGTEVLWPDGEPYLTLMQVKQEGDISFASEKMNYPVDRSKCLIERSELHFWKPSELPKNLLVFGALDPCTGKSSTSKGDFAAILTVGKDLKTNICYVLDCWMSKQHVDKQVNAVIHKHKQWNYFKFGVESQAFQIVIKEHLEKKSRAMGIHIPVVDIKHGSLQNKEMRIEWIYPFLKDGTVILHESQKELISQILNFTPDGRSLHDDGVDSLEMTLRLCLKRHFKRLYR